MSAATRRWVRGRGAVFPFLFPALFLAAALPCGCVSAVGKVVGKAGAVMDGSAFLERTVETWTSRGGGPLDQGVELRRVVRGRERKEYFLVTPRAFPTLVLRAPVPAAGAGRGAGRLVFESLEFFCSNPDGYQEFRRDLAGGGFFREDGYGGFLSLDPGLLALDIQEGRIRRGGTRLSGEEALAALRYRDERIAALVAWMEVFSGGSGEAPRFPGSAAFAAHWGPLLFPELARPGRRPDLWAETLPGEWRRGEDINWNSAYTRAVFPEELWQVRDSGTLLRDWEEALEWVYYQFEWQYIMRTLTGDGSFSAGMVRLVKN